MGQRGWHLGKSKKRDGNEDMLFLKNKTSARSAVTDFLKKNGRITIICVICIAIGLVLNVYERKVADSIGADGIGRESAGNGEESKLLYFSVDGGEKQKVDLDVAAKELTDRESKALMEKALAEWETVFLGKNVSQNQVYYKIVLPETMENGLVKMTYGFDRQNIIDQNGQIIEDGLNEEGELLRMEIGLECNERKLTTVRYLRILPIPLSKEQEISKAVKELLRKKETQSRTDEIFYLPGKLDGHLVTWSAEPGHKGVFVMVAGCTLFVYFLLKKKEQGKKSKEKIERQLLREYPILAEQLSLLVGSGMTVFMAWERILFMEQRLFAMHRTKGKKFVAEMLVTYREIKEGKGEAEAYGSFGERIGLSPYRRLSSLLLQNLTKGNSGTHKQLIEESHDALEQRKHNARKQGEEAGGRLLGPIFIMFVIVIIVVMIPALQKF